jgi:hypothetical protein
MINPSFQQLLYSQPIDTWLISNATEVDALVEEVYQSLLGYELKKNSSKTKSTLNVILLNLYSTVISDPELHLRYSRDENHYSSTNRYINQVVSYQSLVTKVIPGLLRLSLIYDSPGFLNRESNTGFMSRMKTTAGLRKLFSRYKLQPWMLENSVDKEVIILKDQEKKLKKYKDTEFTRTARDQLHHINRHLEAAYVDLMIHEEEMTKLLSRLKRSSSAEEDKHLNLVSNKTLYRIFSNSSWKQHGRFYGGWWQNIPKEYREHISINGEPAVELDYSSFHLRMLYHLCSLEMVGDPYVGIGNLDRDHGKTLVNIIINAIDEDAANAAFMTKYRGESVTKAETKLAIEITKEKHQAINNKFFTGVGLKLMNYDSHIANKVMLRAIDEFQTIILPVHDSFICVRDFEYNLRQLMIEEYIEVMKSNVRPGVVMKCSGYYQTEEDKWFMSEYGAPYDFNPPLDPLQKERQTMLEKQAYVAREKYGIRFEDTFTQEGLEEKYAPESIDDL